MCLNEEKSMELYSVLDGKTLNYIIEGKEVRDVTDNEKRGQKPKM